MDQDSQANIPVFRYDSVMQFERIAILGVGLMGGSLGLACRAVDSRLQTTGYSPGADDVRVALERGAIDRVASDPPAAVREADLVILCTPPGRFGKMLTAVAPALKPGAVVTDVGSIKRSVVRLANDLLPKSIRFVGGHPMVGGEKHGIAHARADLFAGGLCILTPVMPSTDEAEAATAAVEHFWQQLKMRTIRMSPETHDQLACNISHLPHAVAAALVRMQSPESLHIAGRGFLDTTRIAAGDPGIWRDILLDNRDNLRVGIETIKSHLDQLLKVLDGNDASALEQWLKVSSDIRKNI